MAIDQDAAEWFEDNIGPELRTNTKQLEAARESLQKSIRAAAGESEALLNLYLRHQIDDELFERKRREIDDRRATFQLKLEQPQPSGEDLIGRLEKVLQFSLNAPFIFAKAGRVQRRLIVDATTSNWKVRDKEPLCLAKKPFSLLATATTRPKWWTTCVHLRTWLYETTDFYLPDLKIETDHDGSVPEDAAAA